MEDVEPGREKRKQIEAQFLENLQVSTVILKIIQGV
jgi:hypothetical protein